VTILNDFAGIGYGLLALNESDMTVIQKAKVINGAPKAVIGAGTGLGQALLAYDGFNYNVLPTEGGHSDFAPRSLIEYELMKYNKETHGIGRVSAERVVSGSGLPTTYAFFKSKFPDLVNKEVDEQIR
jgi:glucokinase